MKINAYTLNSFAKTKEGGNPAGVVINADALSEEEMRKIAAALGYSETAFVLQSDVADFKVRFFTPNEEVDLCGHATIATFHAMSELNLLKPGAYKQETRAGVLGIELQNDHFVMMEQALHLTFEQGYAMNRPSEIRASLAVKDNRISSVKVGGSAMNLTLAEVEI